MTKDRIHWPDIFRTADVWVEGDKDAPYGMNFSLYEINGVGDNGSHDVESKPDFTGLIKWDGCANLDSGGFHICGVHETDQIAEAFRRLYKEAAKRLPNWDGE